MDLRKTEKTAIFLDGPSIHQAAKNLGFDVDYRRLRELVADGSNLVRALYFTQIDEENESNPIVKMIDFLDYNGWSVVTRRAAVSISADGKRHVRGSMDVDLAVAALDLSPRVDHIILAAGSPAFVSMVKSLQRRGCRVSVLSTIKTSPSCIHDDLRRQADDFVELEELKMRVIRARAAKEAA